MSKTKDRDETFRIRDTALLRVGRSRLSFPSQVTLNADGSAVASYDDGERLSRFESVDECLAFYDLIGVDLEPID